MSNETHRRQTDQRVLHVCFSVSSASPVLASSCRSQRQQLDTRMSMAADFTGLGGKNILVVEDDYFLATEMADAVRDASGTTLGPVPDADAALAIIACTHVDAAVLDINLGDETSFPVASALRSRGVRVVFVTSYDRWFLPNEFSDTPVYRKPVDPVRVVRHLFEPSLRNGLQG